MNISFRDLTVYKKAFELAMEIFEISKTFPKEETYSLTDQIRRSSRSVCTCQVWLDFSYKCNYINKSDYTRLMKKSEEVGKMINHMIEYPGKYLRKDDKFK